MFQVLFLSLFHIFTLTNCFEVFEHMGPMCDSVKGDVCSGCGFSMHVPSLLPVLLNHKYHIMKMEKGN